MSTKRKTLITKYLFPLLLLLLVGFTAYALFYKSIGKKESLHEFARLQGTAESSLREGDIVFQESESAQCTAVKKATKSRYSHCGILLMQNGRLEVFEAIQPVCFTPLEEWIQRGKNEHLVVKRLTSHPKGFDAATKEKMHQLADSFEGRDYDIYFDWSDRRIYCSELVWKLYKRVMNIEVGTIQRLKDFDLSSSEVQRIMAQRYGKNIPYNEEVVSPSSIYDSPLLYEVLRR